jgi:hypothetical protein
VWVVGVAGADIGNVIKVSPDNYHWPCIGGFSVFVEACDRFWQQEDAYIVVSQPYTLVGVFAICEVQKEGCC